MATQVNKYLLLVIAVILALLGGGTHAYQFTVEWNSLGGATSVGILKSSSFAMLQGFFVICFLAVALGVAIRVPAGSIIAALALFGILAGYVYWFSYSSKSFAAFSDPFYAQHPEVVPAHAFGLIGGHWWDVLILALSIILLLCILLSLLSRNNGYTKRDEARAY